ncbi:hypothetical protein HDV04_003289 [Boothiomyces sp. JEL0838]|nr:hypothetical protein HDV04_003267 [Boothiomyces sp. JEL0838]KAJ3312268.1 hypothetical protein HDV04_003289 [Boothiomyces sp. JEL0838]
MNEALDKPEIITKILLYTEAFLTVSQINKKWYGIAKDPKLRAKWLLSRPIKLKIVASTLQSINSDANAFSSYGDWLANRIFPTEMICGTCTKFALQPDVLGALLEYSFEHQKEFINVWWNALAAIGSLAGVAVALNNDSFASMLQNNVSFLSSIVYASIYPLKSSNEEIGVRVLEIFCKLSPLKSTIENALRFACILNKERHIKILLQIEGLRDSILHGMAYSQRKGWTTTFNLLHAYASDDILQLWSIYEEARKQCQTTGPDNLVEKLHSLPIDSSTIVMDIFDQLLESAIELKKSNVVKSLLESMQAYDKNFFVPLHIFDLALSSENWESAEAILLKLDLGNLVSLNSTKQKLQVILEQYSVITKKQLYIRLQPIPCIRQPIIEQEMFLTRHQIAAIKFVHSKLKALDPAYEIDSKLIWGAFQSINLDVAALLGSLGGKLTWMEGAKTNGKTLNLPPQASHPSTPDMNDERFGVFSAFGGIKLDIAGFETLGRVRRLSVTKSNQRLNPTLSSGSPPSSAHSSYQCIPVFLGGKRESMKRTDSRERVNLRHQHQKISGSKTSSNVWNELLGSDSSKFRDLIKSIPETVEWMDNVKPPETVSKIFNELENRVGMTEEPSYVRALAGLY